MSDAKTLGKIVGAVFVAVFVAAAFVAASHIGEFAHESNAAASSAREPFIGPISSPSLAGPLVGPDGEPIILSPPALDYVPATSGQAAVQTAREHIETSVEPTSVKAELAVFGNGDPVWVVTFDGICASVSDGPPDSSESQVACPITRESAIVNAASGEWTSNFWGSRPAASPTAT
jgi:hypothetical protein